MKVLRPGYLQSNQISNRIRELNSSITNVDLAVSQQQLQQDSNMKSYLNGITINAPICDSPLLQVMSYIFIAMLIHVS